MEEEKRKNKFLVFLLMLKNNGFEFIDSFIMYLRDIPKSGYLRESIFGHMVLSLITFVIYKLSLTTAVIVAILAIFIMLKKDEKP